MRRYLEMRLGDDNVLPRNDYLEKPMSHLHRTGMTRCYVKLDFLQFH